MVKQVLVSFRNNKQQLLHGVVHAPSKYETAVVYLHGFPGSMEGSPKRFCAALAQHGCVCLRFNFSGTDTSEGTFADKLMSQEVKDTKAAIDFLTKHYPAKRLVLIGHSTGAIDASLYAHTDKRVSGLVLGGPVSDLKHSVRYDFSDAQVRDFWTKGYTHHKCERRPKKKKYLWLWNAQRGKLKKAFYDEFFTLEIPAEMKKYHKSLLILHGEKDEAIPSQKDPHELFKLANKPKKLVIIKGADHSFTKPAHTKLAVAAILRFIKTLR